MNTQPLLSNNDELFSALVDGEASPSEADSVLAACNREPDLITRWGVYHLVGDVLRASASTAGYRSTLHQKVEARLDREHLQTGVAHLAPTTFARSKASVEKSKEQPDTAANDAVFRWKVVAGVASLLAVSALAWTTLGATSSSSGPQLARMPAPDPILVETAQGPLVRDAALDAMLAAHKQLGATAAQMPSGFLRNATFESQMPKNSGVK